MLPHFPPRNFPARGFWAVWAFSPGKDVCLIKGNGGICGPGLGSCMLSRSPLIRSRDTHTLVLALLLSYLHGH